MGKQRARRRLGKGGQCEREDEAENTKHETRPLLMKHPILPTAQKANPFLPRRYEGLQPPSLQTGKTEGGKAKEWAKLQEPTWAA